ncbi:MAG: hypothetical protein WAN17_15240 [Candidatus Sulfotelmatobacter sp.]
MLGGSTCWIGTMMPGVGADKDRTSLSLAGFGISGTIHVSTNHWLVT